MPKNKIQVVYLHGLGSSGSSTTVQRLQRSLPSGYDVVAPDIPVRPELAVSALRKLAATLRPGDIVVGTSMGGMYAQMFRGLRRLLINPSFHASAHLAEKEGERLPFHNPRQDGAVDYEVNAKLVKKFKELEERQFDTSFALTPASLATRENQELVTGYFGTRDDVVNCKEEFLAHYQHAVDFEGGHRLDPDTTIKLIIPAIVNIGKNQ